MMSIIICSISPIRLEAVKQNITETIGVEHEFVVIKNQDMHWPIAKAYNYGARQAVYPYLFFVHEDVMFHSSEWGTSVEEKLSESDCGVIGFCGTKVKLKSYSGWNQYFEWVSCYLYQKYNDLTRLDVYNAYLEHPFEEVVATDGLGMFVRKEVWNKYPFDELFLTGFHCYDMDFSLQIAQRYKNYVCCSGKVLIEHFSKGNYDSKWFSDTIRLHKCKWNNFLPMKVESTVITEKEMKKHEERLSYDFLYKLLRSDCPQKKEVLKEFWNRPLSWKHIRHCMSCTLKYYFEKIYSYKMSIFPVFYVLLFSI